MRSQRGKSQPRYRMPAVAVVNSVYETVPLGRCRPARRSRSRCHRQMPRPPRPRSTPHWWRRRRRSWRSRLLPDPPRKAHTHWWSRCSGSRPSRWPQSRSCRPQGGPRWWSSIPRRAQTRRRAGVAAVTRVEQRVGHRPGGGDGVLLAGDGGGVVGRSAGDFASAPRRAGGRVIDRGVCAGRGLAAQPRGRTRGANVVRPRVVGPDVPAPVSGRHSHRCRCLRRSCPRLTRSLRPP